MDSKFNSNENFNTTLKSNKSVSGEISSLDNWKVTHRDSDGNIKDEFTFSNRIVNEGLDYALGAALNGETQVTTWYIGLIDASPTVDATDVMASHTGWSEVTAYNESNRQEWVSGSVSSQSITNSSSPVTFTFNADGTNVGGAFLTSDDTTGGSTGTLFAAGAFEKGNKTFDIDDTIEITAEFSNSYS